MPTNEMTYRFEFDDGTSETIHLRIDQRHYCLLANKDALRPVWARLTFQQCPNCPLTPETSPFCPVAAHLVEMVRCFDRMLSYQHAHVVVLSNQRRYSQRTTVQRGLGSLLGLVMATSGCPLTDFFKPMARFHLPFASMEETIWRATATYILAHYFLIHEGGRTAFSFDRLAKIYDDIQKVNLFMARRLRAVCQQDSLINALIFLDMFAKTIPPVIEESLEEIRPFFSSYSV